MYIDDCSMNDIKQMIHVVPKPASGIVSVRMHCNR